MAFPCAGPMALTEMAQELFPVGMGHTALLWEDEPEKISYREELLTLEGLIGEALAETCSVGLWGQDECSQQDRRRTVPVAGTACRHDPEFLVSSIGDQQRAGLYGTSSCRSPQKLVLLRADLTRGTSSSD